MSNLDQYKLVCGLEVHAELKTNSKMFCACKNDPFSAPDPNIYTCPVCLGMPGGTPVANKKAIEWTIKLGLALNCKINLFSKFDRKNYFYPDLAKGYQISQYDIPFCYDGELQTSEGAVRIRRIHLEEDTGKLLHKEVDGEKASLVDFNRSGVPLIEIVTEPDIKSPQQAKEYGRKLRQILRYLDIADCDMDQGGMRLEANISVSPLDATGLPTYKVEVKNINSFRFMEQAIEFEMSRHAQLLDSGKTPDQETRGWNQSTAETFTQRTKEDAEDYRYFPDPDLPPIRFSQSEIDAIGADLPELADGKAERWQKEHGVELRYAHLLTEERQESEWYEEVFSEAKRLKLEPNDLANALVNKKIDVKVGDNPGKVVARYREMTATDDVPETEIANAIDQVMKQNPGEVDRFQEGEAKLLGFFIGQTMKTLGKKVDPNLLRQTLLARLKK